MARRIFASLTACLPRSSTGFLAAGAVAACVGYAATAFLQGRHEVVEPETHGVALISTDEAPAEVPELRPPRVTLDLEPADAGRVVTALLEFPEGAGPESVTTIEPVGGRAPAPASGVWLTGAIEAVGPAGR